MTKSRVLTGIIGAVFCLTLASSARADRFNRDRDVLLDIQLEKLIFAERHGFGIDIQSVLNTNYEYVGHFENNNGKHLGFGKLLNIDIQRVADTSFPLAANLENNNGKHRGISMSVIQQGPRFGLVRETPPTVSATPNPEPTAMVLLGTGLAAVAAFARKFNRKRKI